MTLTICCSVSDSKGEAAAIETELLKDYRFGQQQLVEIWGQACAVAIAKVCTPSCVHLHPLSSPPFYCSGETNQSFCKQSVSRPREDKWRTDNTRQHRGCSWETTPHPSSIGGVSNDVSVWCPGSLLIDKYINKQVIFSLTSGLFF